MVTILIILIPVMCIMTGLFVSWGLYTGLKWQLQIKEGREPTKPVEVPNIPNPFEAIRQEKQEQAALNMLDEWLNGPKEGVK